MDGRRFQHETVPWRGTRTAHARLCYGHAGRRCRRGVYGRSGKRLVSNGGSVGKKQTNRKGDLRHDVQPEPGLHPCAGGHLPLARQGLSGAKDGLCVLGRSDRRVVRPGSRLGRGAGDHQRHEQDLFFAGPDRYPRGNGHLPLAGKRKTRFFLPAGLPGRGDGELLLYRSLLGCGEPHRHGQREAEIRAEQDLHPRGGRDLSLPHLLQLPDHDSAEIQRSGAAGREGRNLVGLPLPAGYGNPDQPESEKN